MIAAGRGASAGSANTGGSASSMTSLFGSQLRKGEGLRLLRFGWSLARYKRRYVRARERATKNRHSSSLSWDCFASSATLKAPAPSIIPRGGGQRWPRLFHGKLE